MAGCTGTEAPKSNLTVRDSRTGPAGGVRRGNRCKLGVRSRGSRAVPIRFLRTAEEHCRKRKRMPLDEAVVGPGPVLGFALAQTISESVGPDPSCRTVSLRTWWSLFIRRVRTAISPMVQVAPAGWMYQAWKQGNTVHINTSETKQQTRNTLTEFNSMVVHTPPAVSSSPPVPPIPMLFGSFVARLSDVDVLGLVNRDDVTAFRSLFNFFSSSVCCAVHRIGNRLRMKEPRSLREGGRRLGKEVQGKLNRHRIENEHGLP
uniref:Uncharacterized protein n=2 Tax=Anopheles culicifacies TaxID=139723 RepID=A0A182MVF3_9DIPT